MRTLIVTDVGDTPAKIDLSARCWIDVAQAIFHRHHVRSSLRREVGSALATVLIDRTSVVSDAVWRSARLGARG